MSGNAWFNADTQSDMITGRHRICIVIQPHMFKCAKVGNLFGLSLSH